MQRSRRACRNDPNSFCNICSEYSFNQRNRRSITQIIKRRHHLYFKMKIGDQDKNFVPHSVCVKCCSSLSMWEAGKLKKCPLVLLWLGVSNAITIQIAIFARHPQLVIITKVLQEFNTQIYSQQSVRNLMTLEKIHRFPLSYHQVTTELYRGI